MTRISPPGTPRHSPLNVTEPSSARSSPIDFSELNTAISSRTPSERLSPHTTHAEAFPAPDQLKMLRAELEVSKKKFAEAAKGYRTLRHFDEQTPEVEKERSKIGGATRVRLYRETEHRLRVERLEDLEAELKDHMSSLEEDPSFTTKLTLQRTHTKYAKELKKVESLHKIARQIVELEEHIEAEKEHRRPQNHAEYQRRTAEIKGLISKLSMDYHHEMAKTSRAKDISDEIQKKVAELEAFDKHLQKSYEGIDPYPYSRVQSAIDWARSWFTEVDTRIPISELLIQYSMAKQGLDERSDAYAEALSGFRLSDLTSFVTQHPVFAAQMAGQLSHVAGLLSGSGTAGAALQTAIAKQRAQNIAMNFLGGKNYSADYAQEFDHPLTPQQIALIDLLSKAPYAAAAALGAVGGSIAGTITAMAQVKAQEVLAESLGRNGELIASSISFIVMENDWGEIASKLQTASAGLGFNYESISRLKDISSTVFEAGMKAVPAISMRGQADKAHRFATTLASSGLQAAVRQSAKKTFSGNVAQEIVIPEAEPALFAVNLLKFIRAFRLLPKSQVKTLLSYVPLEAVIDKAKFLDSRPGNVLTALRPFLRPETTIFLEKHKNLFSETAVFALKDLFTIEGEGIAYEFFRRKLQENTKGQTQDLAAELAKEAEERSKN